MLSLILKIKLQSVTSNKNRFIKSIISFTNNETQKMAIK